MVAEGEGEEGVPRLKSHETRDKQGIQRDRKADEGWVEAVADGKDRWS